jgi:hypothetical protein
MHAHKVLAHKTHAYKVYPYEIHTREMHACEIPAHGMHIREMYTREIYAHRSVAFLGRCGCCKKGAPELNRFIPHPRDTSSSLSKTSCSLGGL